MPIPKMQRSMIATTLEFPDCPLAVLLLFFCNLGSLTQRELRHPMKEIEWGSFRVVFPFVSEEKKDPSMFHVVTV